MQDARTLRMQQEISAELGVALRFDAQVDMQRRVAFLADYLISSGFKTLILGISGGIDSCTAGRLAQLGEHKEGWVSNVTERNAGRIPACSKACRAILSASRRDHPTIPYALLLAQPLETVKVE